MEYKRDPNCQGAVIPKRVHTILISTQHSPEVSNEQIHKVGAVCVHVCMYACMSLELPILHEEFDGGSGSLVEQLCNIVVCWGGSNWQQNHQHEEQADFIESTL